MKNPDGMNEEHRCDEKVLALIVETQVWKQSVCREEFNLRGENAGVISGSGTVRTRGEQPPGTHPLTRFYHRVSLTRTVFLPSRSVSMEIIPIRGRSTPLVLQ